jgi:NAD+ synthase (glutamine-hydrolysing)
MPRLRLALAQVNPTVGDVAGNADLVREAVAQAADAGADVIAFPEMVLTGYPIEDLALRPSFQAASRAALADLAAALLASGHGEIAAIVGYLDSDTGVPETLGIPVGRPVNAAAVLHRGAVVSRYAKHHLPNYGVFDEFRYFVPGDSLMQVRVCGVDIAVVICEDLWQDGGPVARVREAGAGLLVVINGSPYEQDKDDVRGALCSRRARDAGCALAYVNMVGGQDELVFDGDSLVVDASGELVARSPQFTDDVLVVDLELPEGTSADPTAVVLSEASASLRIRPDVPARIAEPLDDPEQVWQALVVGLRDYVLKNGFRSVLLGLSGGIDSAVVAAIACDAIGAANVHGISMPSRYSSQHSRDDAADLAQRTGLHMRTIEIDPMVQAYLGSMFLTGLAEENLQARVRGTTLMAASNQEGHLVLATGNKSELAVGYSTIYGDAVGGFAPIKDVPKTQVWALARWRNEIATARGHKPPIPESSISKPPSAELRPDQLDSDSLPDYSDLDRLIDGYVHGDRGAEDLVADGFDATLVERILRLIDSAEYKRRQYPPGTKISLRAFGRDRRLPVTNQWREGSGPTPRA